MAFFASYQDRNYRNGTIGFFPGIRVPSTVDFRLGLSVCISTAPPRNQSTNLPFTSGGTSRSLTSSTDLAHISTICVGYVLFLLVWMHTGSAEKLPLGMAGSPGSRGTRASFSSSFMAPSDLATE